MCTSHRRTVQFGPLIDLMFSVGDFLLPRDTPAEHFSRATQIVLTLDNQKNSIRGETVSHFRSKSAAACPVKAGINIFLRLCDQGCAPTTPISDYPSDHGLRSVSASNISAFIRAECLRVGAARLGFAPEDIGTHSLRSGGAMAMHLAEVPNRTLMAIGRWRSLGFM